MAIATSKSMFSQIGFKEITLGEFIDQGGYGTVYKGVWNGKNVAIKKLQRQNLSERSLKEFKKETEIWASCRHEHIVNLFGVCLEQGNYSMVMEYCPKGSLYNVLHKVETLSWNPHRFQMAIGTGKGLAYLHNHYIIHGNLNSSNVLLDNEYRPKITDFA